MVETGSRRSLLGPAAIAVLLLLVVAGVVAGGGRVDAGHPSPAAAGGPLAATAGCGTAPALASGTHTIQSNGRNRTFILRLPDNYDANRPYRLVLGFHWLNGTATDVATGQTVQRDTWAYYGLLRLGSTSTIFVAPQGLNNGWGNAGGEDLTFVDDILRRLDAGLCVDTAQRFALGFSYGAAMSFALACARPTVFRAVAVYSGGQLSGCSGGTQPIAYLAAHGLRDNVLNISGGRSMRDRFVGANGCAAQNPPEPAQGSLSHRTTTYTGCRTGYPVVWAAFDEGHIAAPQDGAPGDSGSRTWLPAETWRFFTQFESTGPEPSSPGSSSPPPPGACRVAATVNSWNTGLTEDLTITNTSTTAVNGWTLSFTLPGGQSITSGWNATYAPTSGTVAARNVGYNTTIAPGASVAIGFQATHTGNAARPASFALNGATCATA
jgi:poly(3-hydroxybutyrate) depolymerase